MSQNNKLIANQTLAIFRKHLNRVKGFGENLCELQPKENHDRTFSYKDRYELKKEDPDKKRFCQDVALSKQYQNLLRDYAHLLVRNVEIYFEEEELKNQLKN